MNYRLKILAQDGTRRRVTAPGSTPAEVTAAFKSRGFRVLEIRPVGNTRFFLPARWFEKRLPKGTFLSEIAVLLRSGMRLQDALVILEKTGGEWGPFYARLLARLREGHRFSQVLEEAGMLGPTERALLRAGEETGEFQEMLETLVRHVREGESLRQKLVSTAIYPLFLMGFGALVLSYMVFGVLPRLTESLAELQGGLPATSRLLLDVLEWVRLWGWTLLPTVVLVLYGVHLYSRRRPGALQESVFRMPVIGDLYRMRLLGVFLPPLLVLLKKKVPLAEIVSALRHSYGSVPLIGDLVARLETEKSKGVSLAKVLATSPLFTPKERELLLVSDQASRLVEMLGEVARQNLETYENRTKSVLSLLEPMAIIFIGLAVLFFVLTVVLPIISLQTAF